MDTMIDKLENLENGTKIMLMAGEPITVLSVLSITAIVSTISLFFCGIPICINIWKRKSTDEISGFPFIMGLLGGAFWLRYGLLKVDFCMITVNVVGCTLMFSYTIFYVFYTRKKLFVLLQVTLVLSIIATMLFLVQIYDRAVQDPLGFVCMTFNIVNFGAPLAGIRVVLRKQCCDTLPLPLCIANFLVSSQWCLYGLLINDIYIIIPNAAGMALAIIQLSLFLIFPKKIGGVSPCGYCFRCANKYKSAEDCETTCKASNKIIKVTKEKKEPAKNRVFGILRKKCSTAKNDGSHRLSATPTTCADALPSTVNESPEAMLLAAGEPLDKIPELDDPEENWNEYEPKFAQSGATILTTVSDKDEADIAQT